MNNNYPQIQELLQQKADYQARLNLLPYDGSPEIKEQHGQKYLYIRRHVSPLSMSTSTRMNCISSCCATRGTQRN